MTAGRSTASIVYALAAFLGSFLLFLIQPMAAKRLLPVFGGSSAVWTASLLFFQAALFAGYAYAAIANRRAHAVALLFAVVAALLPFSPAVAGMPPVVGVFVALAGAVGVPFFVLSAGSTLLQRWAGTYSLYAVSNAGSIAALLAYPVVVEPLFNLPGQQRLWLLGGAVYVALMAWLMLRSEDRSDAVYQVRPAWKDLLWWTAFSACGSALLASTTNQICQEVASIPFLWVVPLAIYLASFIVTFQWEFWRRFAVWSLLLPLASAGAVALFALGPKAGFQWHLAVDLLTLAVCLMLCHGQLAKTRPPHESLGWFYVAMSAGGVLGGLFVAVIAPLLFTTYLEFPLLLAIAAGLALSRGLIAEGLIVEPIGMLKRVQLFGLATAIAAPLTSFTTGTTGLLDERRNFYGVLQVAERDEAQGPLRTLVHGQTVHGTQWVRHPEWPTTYYNENSGVARTIRDEQRIRPHGAKIGLIGLGAGTLAVYAREEDRFRFYELNPDVEALARKHFTYLSSTKNVEIVLGDARVRLSQDPPQQFDSLVVDAFSSDSIPVHLLTREAAALYATHVKPEGTILFHISNRALNLEPVVRGLARFLHRRYEMIHSGDSASRGGNAALWVRLSPGGYEGPPGILWTDAYSSLWPILRIR